jgi:hypothetical protein
VNVDAATVLQTRCPGRQPSVPGALVFMWLRRSAALPWLAVLTGLAALALLFVLGGSDYATRHRAGAPWQTPGTVPGRPGPG